MRTQHPIYSMKGIEDIEQTHKKPDSLKDRAAKSVIRLMRGTFDKISGYNPDKMSER